MVDRDRELAGIAMFLDGALADKLGPERIRRVLRPRHLPRLTQKPHTVRTAREHGRRKVPTGAASGRERYLPDAAPGWFAG